MTKVKVDGSWRQLAAARVKVDGSWRFVASSYVKVDGSWRLTDLGSPPAKPTLQHTGYGQFTITNYQPSLQYTVSVSAGTFTRTGAVITLTDLNATVTVTAAVGTLVSPAGTGTRMAYTSTFHITNSYTHGWPAHEGSGGGTYSCTWSPENNYAQHYEGYTSRDPVPSGFTDSFGEWIKVT